MTTTDTSTTHTPSGTAVATIDSMEKEGLKAWKNYLKEIGSVPWGSK